MKIVQIAVARVRDAQSNDYESLYVLSDDGRIWLSLNPDAACFKDGVVRWAQVSTPNPESALTL